VSVIGPHSARRSAGGGFALSFDQKLGAGIVPFLRFGYGPAGLFDASVEVSWGVATVSPFGRSTDRAGLGTSWGKPVEPAGRDQFATEVFYRLEVIEGIAVSADVELIVDPALQPDRDFVAVLGLRTRLSL
jgi:porin